MADITITSGTELSPDTLFYPPDYGADLKGNKATDWIDGKLPISKTDAILKARAANQPLFDSIKWEPINTDLPHYVTGTTPQSYNPTSTESQPFDLIQWSKENWKWVLPIGVGLAIILTRR